MEVVSDCPVGDHDEKANYDAGHWCDQAGRAEAGRSHQYCNQVFQQAIETSGQECKSNQGGNVNIDCLHGLEGGGRHGDETVNEIKNDSDKNYHWQERN